MVSNNTKKAAAVEAPPPETYYKNKNNHYYRRMTAAVLLTVITLHLWQCPHSKVEESFPLQAVHDLFYYGLQPALVETWNHLFDNELTPTMTVLPYDHTQFPGVVPRTFAGPALLAAACQMIRGLLYLVVTAAHGIMTNTDTINSDAAADTDTTTDIAHHPVAVQAVARFVLGLVNWHAWCRFAAAVDHRHRHHTKQSGTIGTYLLLTTACQFHLPFYASRMLPNTFAVCLTLHAFSYWLLKKVPAAAACLVAAAAVVRCDVILLVFTAGLSWLHAGQLTIPHAIQVGVVTGVASLFLTVPLDSLLWQRPVWPEGVVFYFNAVLGQSEQWGTEPWYWYWKTALPKVLLGSVVTVPLAVLPIMEHLVAWEGRQRGLVMASKNKAAPSGWIDSTWLPFLLPAFGFVALYSCLGHKETRFLFPVLPLWNLAAAVGLGNVHTAAFEPFQPDDSSAQKKKNDDRDEQQEQQQQQATPYLKRSILGRLVYVGCVGLLLLTLAASSAFVAVSRWNYPGGDALNRLIQRIEENQSSLRLLPHHEKRATVRVHVDVASTMTGVSLFGQREATARVPAVEWVFDKAGYEEENLVPGGPAASAASSDWTSMYTHLLTEDKDVADPDLFRVVDVIQGNPRLDLKRARIVTTDTIYILERKDFLGW